MGQLFFTIQPRQNVHYTSPMPKAKKTFKIFWKKKNKTSVALDRKTNRNFKKCIHLLLNSVWIVFCMGLLINDCYCVYLVNCSFIVSSGTSSWPRVENLQINQSEQLTAARFQRKYHILKTLQSSQPILRISQTHTEKEIIYCILLLQVSYTDVFIVSGLRSQSLHRQQSWSRVTRSEPGHMWPLTLGRNNDELCQRGSGVIKCGSVYIRSIPQHTVTGWNERLRFMNDYKIFKENKPK